MFAGKTARVGACATILLAGIAISACCGGESSSKETSGAASASKPAKTSKTSKPAETAKPESTAKAKPAKTGAPAKPGEVMDPTALQTAFFADKAAWKGKQVRVKGDINSTQDASKNKPPKYFISLRSPGKSGYQVYAEFDLAGGKAAPQVKNGQNVTVNCKVDKAFFKSVKLIDCSME